MCTAYKYSLQLQKSAQQSAQCPHSAHSAVRTPLRVRGALCAGNKQLAFAKPAQHSKNHNKDKGKNAKNRRRIRDYRCKL